MLSTSAASAKAFPIKQYNQLYVAIAVFTDGVCGHEYPAKCVEVLGPGNDLARNADGKPKAKKKDLHCPTLANQRCLKKTPHIMVIF